jgi:hypothetical protein
MDSSRKVNNGSVLHHKNDRKTVDAKLGSETPHFTNRIVSKPPKQSKRHFDSRLNFLNNSEKNKASRKVDKFIYPKLDNAVKVRTFINNIIKGCDVILKNVSSDFDKAKIQVSQLKDEVEHLAKEITIAKSNEILKDLDIDFTLLEELQGSSIDIKSTTVNHIRKAQINLRELYKEIQSIKYIKYNKPKIILIVRYILECFRSLYNYIFQATDAKIEAQDKNKLADNQEKFLTANNNQQSRQITSDIAQNDKQNNTDFDSVSNQSQDMDSNLTAADQDVLEEDGVHADSIETITDDEIISSQYSTKKLTHTVNISTSALKNYGSTCWLNSSIKALYVLYKDAIKEKADERLKNPHIGLQEKQLYTSILLLFNKLETQEDASKEVEDFLMNLFIYGKDVVSNNKNIPAIKNIQGLIEDIQYTVTQSPDDESKNIMKLNLASVKQCSADEFIANFKDFMDLNNDSNSLGEIDLEERYLNKDVLNRIGFADTDKPKAIKRNKVDEYRSNLIAINTENLQESDTNKDDLIRMLSDDSNTSDFSKEEKQKITDFLFSNDIDSKKRLVNVAYTKEFTANIEQLKTVTINLQAATAHNSIIKNNERLNQLFDEHYPYITFNVLNRSDSQMYKVTAKAISCVAHQGFAITAGHYIACSIDESSQVTIHNDSNNYELPKTKNLQDFVKQEGFTPIVIGYAVIDKQPIRVDTA